MAKLKWIHHKTAKGKAYVYFDTGALNDNGGKILKRLPSERSPEFPRAYSLAYEQRTKRAKEPAVSRTFDGLMRLFEKSPEFRDKAKNTQRSYLLYLNRVSALLRDREGNSVPAEDLTPQDVTTIRDHLADGHGANQAVRSIGALYAWGMKPGRGHVTHNPARGIPFLDEGEHEPWPEWLIEEALADPIVRKEVALLYFTGQRIGDVVRMQWSDIKNGMIEVRQQKTGTPLLIAMLPELLGIVQAIDLRGFTVLTHSGGGAWSTSGLRQHIQRWAKERGQKVVPHGLRKNAVNALLEAGCSAAEVNAITGQDLKTIEHYAKKRDRSKLSTAAVLKLETARNIKRT